MNEPLENLYFNWLCAKVLQVDVPTPSTTYDRLFTQLHNTEFVWLVNCDDNRGEDGKELRNDFIRESGLEDDDDWHCIGCSVFEMLIAFAKRSNFQTDDSVSAWFWEFLDNLGLADCNDASTRLGPDEIDDILNTFVWRTYPPNGEGGLFPIKDPKQDQRKVEVWYQFCDYLRDNDRMI